MKNNNISEDDLLTPKSIRALAVSASVTAFKSVKTNFENKNINHFELKEKTSCKTFQMDKTPNKVHNIVFI